MANKFKQENAGGEELLREGVHKESNNERFNKMLNRCKHPQRVYIALMSFIEPSIEQADNMFEKRKVLIRDLLAGLDISKGDK